MFVEDRRVTSRVRRPADAKAYAYLLGMYLGDGHVTENRRSFQLRITLDAAYPGIIDECRDAVAAVLPTANVCLRRRSGWEVRIVDAASVSWPLLFPQHGPGRKHLRRIELVPWQEAIVCRFPEQLLRGLIHSDGCRCINRFTTTLPSGRVAEYQYPRYFFTNESQDIKDLFCRTCERLDIRWTRSSRKNISVSHRRSVAKLDAFIGPTA